VVKARSNAPAAPATTMAVAPVAAPKPSIKMAAKAEAKAPAAKNDPNMQLYQAALLGQVESMRAALKAGAVINKTQTVNKISPLQAAVLSDNPAAVLFLIENKADVNARDALGRTPLMTLASEGGVTTMVVALLDKGADITLVDNDGMNAQALADESLKAAKDEKTRKMFQEISDAIPNAPEHK
jgi:ankyrin repeat protein